VYDAGIIHANLQGTFYDYQQKLPGHATANDLAFLNVSSWAFAYEIPTKANMISASFAVDLIGERLTAHVNYSDLSGGTTEADSWITSAGLRSFGKRMDLFLEVYYGRNDPQLSGAASGYGRNANVTDMRIDFRVFYHLRIASQGSED